MPTLPEQNTDIRVIQVLLGRAKLENTALYAGFHQDNQSGREAAGAYRAEARAGRAARSRSQR